MNRQNKRNIVTLATFFVMILLFCVKATGVHIQMLVGLAFIAALVAVLVSGFIIPFLRGAI